MSFDPQLIKKPLKLRSGDMSVGTVTEMGEECGLCLGPGYKAICVHVRHPDQSWISCSCFLLRHHSLTSR